MNLSAKALIAYGHEARVHMWRGTEHGAARELTGANRPAWLPTADWPATRSGGVAERGGASGREKAQRVVCCGVGVVTRCWRAGKRSGGSLAAYPPGGRRTKYFWRTATKVFFFFLKAKIIFDFADDQNTS